MAMDGVEGEARAGWSYERILSLFYPGTSTSHSYGAIRVGLAEGGAQHVTLPSGGSVAGIGVRPGGGVTVRPAKGGRLALRFDVVQVERTPASAPKQTPKPTPTPKPKKDAVLAPIQLTPPPVPPVGGAPTPRPRPTPRPTPTGVPPALTGATVFAPSPVVVSPQGFLAVVRLDATGRRYRGTLEMRRSKGGVTAVNRVGLEDYVAGIAEEKGAGWPLEGMKTLAVAARTLAVATTTWLGSHHADGYDICATDSCQVYLGYDGEESTMRAAANATAGEIRTYNGEPILAMYHGNGGGQTQSYADVSDGKSSAYPYLASVKYPYADPWKWRLDTSLHEIADALQKDGVTNLPTPLRYVIVLKRGETPRVKRVGLFSNSKKGIAVTGLGFAHALKLPSNWFSVHLPHRVPKGLDAAFIGTIDGGPSDTPLSPHHSDPWVLRILAAALVLAASATSWGVTGSPARIGRRLRGLVRLPKRVAARPAADASPS